MLGFRLSRILAQIQFYTYNRIHGTENPKLAPTLSGIFPGASPAVFSGSAKKQTIPGRKKKKKQRIAFSVPSSDTSSTYFGNELEPFISEGITVTKKDALCQPSERCFLVQPAANRMQSIKNYRRLVGDRDTTCGCRWAWEKGEGGGGVLISCTRP